METQKVKKKTTYIITMLLVLLAALFVAGIIIVLCATSIGQNAGYAAITRNGGSMDTSVYQLTIQSAISSAQIAGGILAGVSGLGALMTGMLLYREKEKQ